LNYLLMVAPRTVARGDGLLFARPHRAGRENQARSIAHPCAIGARDYPPPPPSPPYHRHATVAATVPPPSPAMSPRNATALFCYTARPRANTARS